MQYDMTPAQKQNMSNMINKFYNQWDPENKVKLICGVKNIVENSKDELIKEIANNDPILQSLEYEFAITQLTLREMKFEYDDGKVITKHYKI